MTTKRCQWSTDWWYTVEDRSIASEAEPGSGLVIKCHAHWVPEGRTRLLRQGRRASDPRCNQLYPPTLSAVDVSQAAAADPVEAALVAYRQLRDASADLLRLLEYYIPEDTDRPTVWDPCRKRLRRLLKEVKVLSTAPSQEGPKS